MPKVLEQAASVTLKAPFIDSNNFYHPAGTTILAAGETLPSTAVILDDDPLSLMPSPAKTPADDEE